MNGTTYNGTTLLHVAVSRKCDRTVDLLLANGADYMKKDRSTKSPLDLAKEKGRREYVDKFEAKKREFENVGTKGLIIAIWNGLINPSKFTIT